MVRRSRAQWLGLLAKFEESGESVAKFCARRQIPPKTFSWWRWHLRDEGRVGSAREGVRLIAVDVAAPTVTSAAPAVRIVLAGMDVHVTVGTDAEYVGALVAALRSRC